MDLINLKSVGIDPVKVEAIQDNVASITKRLDWISLAVVSVIQQIAAKFHFELPPLP